MPHVIIKMMPGRDDRLKTELADAVARVIATTLALEESSVSVAIDEVRGRDWKEAVYEPEILKDNGRLFRKPGYTL